MGRKMHKKREKRTHQRFANLLAMISDSKARENIELRDKYEGEDRKAKFLYATGSLFEILESLSAKGEDGINRIVGLELKQKMELKKGEFEVE